MTASATRDPVNQGLIEIANEFGLERFGLMNNQVWRDDPRRLVFTLARYKFVAKMLAGQRDVAEVGCGDAFCARLVKQEVDNLLVTDFDPIFIADIEARAHSKWPMTARVHDILAAPLQPLLDALYALDVIEHVPPELEGVFLNNVAQSLRPDGIAIIGLPSLESQSYASPASKAGHVNCQSGDQFRQTLQRWFRTVFMFSMNDEVVHTGFMPMAHYILGLCVGPRTGGPAGSDDQNERR